MNALYQHVEYCEKNLDERTAWRALIDHIEEDRNCDHDSALRSVAKMHVDLRKLDAARRARRAVAHAIAKKTPLLRMLRFYSRSPHAVWTQSCVVDGFARPVTTTHEEYFGTHLVMASHLTVGARFVLMLEGLLKRNQWTLADYHAHRQRLEAP